MAEIGRVGDLKIDQDLGYERRALRLRNVFAVVWGLVLVAALLGGLRNRAAQQRKNVGRAAAGQVRALHAVRHDDRAVDRAGRGRGEDDIAISRPYLHDLVINDIQPQPEGATVLPDRIVYSFDVQPPAEVKFFSTFRGIGRQTATIWGPGGRRLSYTQFVYP